MPLLRRPFRDDTELDDGDDQQPQQGLIAPPPTDSLPPSVYTPVTLPSKPAGPKRSGLDEATNQTAADQTKLAGDTERGSGIDRFASHHRFLGPLARIADVAGSIAAPAIAVNIPGSSLNFRRQLAQDRAGLASDVGTQKEQADIGHTQAETDALQNPQPKPITSEFELWHQQNPTGTLTDFEQEKESGKPQPQQGPKDPFQLWQQQNPNGKAEDYLKLTQKAPAEEALDKQYSDAIAKGDHETAQRILKVKHDMAVAGQPYGAEHLQIAVQGQQDKQAEQKTKQAQPFNDILDSVSEARDYAAEKSGPGDYALLLRVVDATKPSKGFRFTQSEQNLLIGARSIANQADALYQKAAGGQLLTDQQRKQMLDVMGIVEKHAQTGLQRVNGGTPQAGTSDAIEYVRGTDGKLHPAPKAQ